MVRDPRDDEQEIGQTIDIPEQHGIDRRIERHHGALRPAADGAGHMERCAAGGPAGENEVLERRQTGLQTIDQLLEPRDVLVAQPRFGGSIAHLPAWIRQLRTQRKQISLQPDQLGVDLRFGRARTREAEMRVQLIDVAVRLDAGIVLPDACPAEERCFTGISGPRVDLHGQEA